MTRIPLLSAGILCLFGCSTQTPEPPPVHTVPAQSVPAEGLWLELQGEANHPHPVGHGATISWVPTTWVIDDGALVKTGDPLVRYDADALREDNERDSLPLLRDDLRKERDLLQGAAGIESLRTRIHRIQAQRTVVAAELDASRHTDADEIHIAQMQLANVESEHMAAVHRLEALNRLVAVGSPVSGADLAKAREDEARTRAEIVPRQVTLELARLPAARSTVKRLELTLADLDAQLGSNPEEGLTTALRTAEERQKRRELDRGHGHGEWRRRRFRDRAMVLQHPTIDAKVDGIAVLSDPDMRAGVKLAKGTSCVFVLSADGMSAKLAVPEGQRAWLHEGSRLSMLLPAMSGQRVEGTVLTIGPVPDKGRDGTTAFPAMVRLDDIPTGLRQGMSIDCRIAVDLAQDVVLIPSFCLIDPDLPAVLMQDGTQRQLSGWLVGSWFATLHGLSPGERVQVPTTTHGREGQRLSALVEPADFTPVRLRSWGWEVLELLPEGTVMKTGDHMASLTKVDHWRDADYIRSEIELNGTQSRLDLVVSQLAASEARATAQTAWTRSRLRLDRARLEAWVVRNTYDAVAQARSEASLTTALVSAERCERELVATRTEYAAGGISARRLRESQLAAQIAVLGVDRARLEAVGQELSADWLEQLRLDAEAANAADAESAERANASLAGEAFRASLAGAMARFDSAQNRIAALRRSIADEEILSPADGTLVYNRSKDGPPRPGQELETWEPFRIATGRTRRASFEVPIRYYGRIKPGQRLSLSGSGIDETVEAEVTEVSNSFQPPSSFADEVALGRTLGVEERIFRVTLSFTPERDDVMPPGSSVHVDL